MMSEIFMDLSIGSKILVDKSIMGDTEIYHLDDGSAFSIREGKICTIPGKWEVLADNLPLLELVNQLISSEKG